MKEKSQNSFYFPFLILTVVSGLGKFAYDTFLQSNVVSIDTTFCLLLLVSIAALINSANFSQNSTITLGHAIIILSMITQPKLNVYCLIIASFVLTKVISVIFKLDIYNNKIFDVHLIYNVSIQLLICGIFYGLMQKALVFSDFYRIACLGLLAFAIEFFTMVSVGLVASLENNNNEFKNIRFFFLRTAFLESLIVILMYMLMDTYGHLGFIVFILFMVLLNGGIAQSMNASELNKRLTCDPLTNCFNRSHLEGIVKNLIRRRKPFTLLFFDIDDFKSINDYHGHVVGDAVLITFCNEIRRYLRRNDKLFRYAGDEFCVILDESLEAQTYAQRLTNINPVKCKNDEKTIEFTFSVGYICYDKIENSDDIFFEHIIDAADRKMYLDKANRKVNRTIET